MLTARVLVNTMAIDYIHEPTGDKVAKEPWRWVAIYKDQVGVDDDNQPVYQYTTLSQFEVVSGQARFHKFAEIDQSRLCEFVMEHDKHPKRHLMFDPETMELQHFYRNMVLRDFLEDGIHTVERRERVYCFGYKQNGEYHLTALLPNGADVIANRLDFVVVV